MGHEDDATPIGVEFLDIGPVEPRAHSRGRRRRATWLAFLLVAVLAAIVVAVAIERHGKPSAAHAPASRSLLTSSAPGTSFSPSPTASTPARLVVTKVGHRLLGVTAGWELFGRGDAVMVRVQLSVGQITSTPVPVVASSGPISFVVGTHGALALPLDFVPGYLVPDGTSARALPDALGSHGGPAVAGPAPNEMWLPNNGDRGDRMNLVNLSGRSLGTWIPVPTDSSAQQAIPDGSGYVLFAGLGGAYDARPDGLRRITTGAVLAVGRTSWLISECDDRDHCTTSVIDRASGARHNLARIASDVNTPAPGLISPDGITAALIDFTHQDAAIHLRDLVSGADHPLPVPTDQGSFNPGSLVWSPDGRWLFIVAANGHLAVVDAHTRRVGDLGTELPALSQLAIRGPTS